MKLPPHVKLVRNRLGRPYLYLTVHRGTARESKAIRLPDDPRTPEFWAAYAHHMNLPAVAEKKNSFKKLIEAWHASPEWNVLGDGTKREWLRHCKRIEAAWGNLEVRGIEPKHVLALRDEWADTPASANNMMRCLSSMLGWSVPRDWRSDNPCREVKPLKGGAGYAPWPWEAIEDAKANLREDLWWAVALALYTGQRQGDCLTMLWSAIRGNRIYVKQEKTGKELMITIHRDLQAVLDVIPRRAVTILTSAEGTPWQTGFQMSWNKHKPQLAKERGLVFHGLRKSAVVMLLEAGCSDAEVAAVTGQSRSMVEHYAKRVNQEKLAAAAVLKWEAAKS